MTVQGISTVEKITDNAITGALTSTSGAAAEVVMAVLEGMTMISAWFHGVYGTATVSIECSFNGGTTWMNLFGQNVGNAAGTNTPVSKQTNATIGWEAAIPAGVTHIRAHCTEFTSGTVEAMLAQGASQYEPAITAVVGSSSNVIGAIFAPGQWTDLSSTTLGGGASFTGGSTDLAVVATATGFTSGSIGVGEVRISATSDKVGTLYLETSRDNSVWKRVKGVTLAKFDSSCENYGEIVHRPSERYCRAVFVNGAEAQTAFKCQMMRVGVA